MKDQRKIQDLRFQMGVFLIRAQHTENILRSRQILLRIVDVQTLSAGIMIVCLITIHGQKRKYADQVQTLPKNIWQRNIIRILVITVKGQYTSGQSIHNIFGRRLHDHIPDKIGRQ